MCRCFDFRSARMPMLSLLFISDDAEDDVAPPIFIFSSPAFQITFFFIFWLPIISSLIAAFLSMPFFFVRASMTLRRHYFHAVADIYVKYYDIEADVFLHFHVSRLRRRFAGFHHFIDAASLMIFLSFLLSQPVGLIISIDFFSIFRCRHFDVFFDAAISFSSSFFIASFFGFHFFAGYFAFFRFFAIIISSLLMCFLLRWVWSRCEIFRLMFIFHWCADDYRLFLFLRRFSSLMSFIFWWWYFFFMWRHYFWLRGRKPADWCWCFHWYDFLEDYFHFGRNDDYFLVNSFFASKFSDVNISLYVNVSRMIDVPMPIDFPPSFADAMLSISDYRFLWFRHTIAGLLLCWWWCAFWFFDFSVCVGCITLISSDFFWLRFRRYFVGRKHFLLRW